LRFFLDSPIPNNQDEVEVELMTIKIQHDANSATASVEFMITRALPDYDLNEVEALKPRDVDPILASQGFKDLLDEARAILANELAVGRLAIAQLTGAICHDHNVCRPGIWLVVRETGAGDKGMSQSARTRLAEAAETLRSSLHLS
jgi:hypothetical protein